MALTKAGFLVTLKGVDTYWVTCSGIDDEAQTSEHSDGLSNRVFHQVGPRKLKPITLGKEFDPAKDAAIVSWWRSYVEGQTQSETISITPVRYAPDPQPIGASITVYGVKPTSLKGFEADKKSNDASMLTLGLIADDWEYN
jgi:hypothetical protein